MRVGVHANSGRVSDAYGAFPEGRGNSGWGHTEQAGSTLASKKRADIAAGPSGDLVEAAGVEPASANHLILVLHA